jgi:hypothetical protein
MRTLKRRSILGCDRRSSGQTRSRELMIQRGRLRSVLAWTNLALPQMSRSIASGRQCRLSPAAGEGTGASRSDRPRPASRFQSASYQASGRSFWCWTIRTLKRRLDVGTMIPAGPRSILAGGSYSQGRLDASIEPSARRTSPRCPTFPLAIRLASTRPIDILSFVLSVRQTTRRSCEPYAVTYTGGTVIPSIAPSYSQPSVPTA